MSENCQRNQAYQKLLKKTKVGKHADNYKHRYLLPNPDKICNDN